MKLMIKNAGEEEDESSFELKQGFGFKQQRTVSHMARIAQSCLLEKSHHSEADRPNLRPKSVVAVNTAAIEVGPTRSQNAGSAL